MNCYNFIFGKNRFLLHWTIPESTDVCFRVVFGGGGGGVLLGSGGGRCWKKPILIDRVSNEWIFETSAVSYITARDSRLSL